VRADRVHPKTPGPRRPGPGRGSQVSGRQVSGRQVSGRQVSGWSGRVEANRDPAVTAGIHSGYAHIATVTHLAYPGRFLRRGSHRAAC